MYTYVLARETVNRIAQDLPHTPRHSAGVVGMWAVEDVGRLGVEWYYTGRQALEENPYRRVSDPYVIVGVLAERQLGRIRLFINGENLSSVGQTKWDPLLRPARAMDCRWTVYAWAPWAQRQRRDSSALLTSPPLIFRCPVLPIVITAARLECSRTCSEWAHSRAAP
jgi:hypothetical protein